jgi:hypothetical protein
VGPEGEQRRVEGNLPLTAFAQTLAMARGPVYVEPEAFDAPPAPVRQAGADAGGPRSMTELKRRGLVVSGGAVAQDRPLYLTLREPSWTLSAIIADRINERFPKAPSAAEETAIAKDDATIQLNLPDRYGYSTEEMIQLILHLYTQRAPEFETRQAERLAEVLSSQPGEAVAVSYAWEGLGEPALPVIGRYYDHPDSGVRLAAIRAGARLGDRHAADAVLELASDPDPQQRRFAAKVAADLLPDRRAEEAIGKLLSDADPSVQIEMYHAISEVDNGGVLRMAVGKGVDFKFHIDLVPSDNPLVYVSHRESPRIVLFDVMLPLKRPTLAKFFDNRMMLRTDADRPLMRVFHQSEPGKPAEIYEAQPMVGNLVFLLGHRPTMEHPTEGLNLSFTRIVSVLKELCEQGAVDAPFRAEPLEIFERIEARRQAPQLAPARPEFSPERSPEGPSPQPRRDGSRGRATTADSAPASGEGPSPG